MATKREDAENSSVEQVEERADYSMSQLLRERGVSRRDFLKFCSTISVAMALPASFAPKIAEALDEIKRPPLIWLEFQDCAGDTEALLRAANPSVADIILDILSIDYHETIMAAAGKQAEMNLEKTISEYAGKYICVVEGSIPMANGGVYSCVGGKTNLERARQICSSAAATIALGNCAAFGGIAAAAPNPTGAVGVKEAVPGATVINLPGCPVNADNLTATIVHYLVFGKIPALDSHQRPVFIHGKRVHDNCERRYYFETKQFVEFWGDEAHRKGYCLYKMGCRGAAAFNNCPTQRFNSKTSWPVASGCGCYGCSEPNFWEELQSMNS